MTRLTICAFALVLTGCPAVHQSPATRAQEAASELNINTRFGRMEMASEFVSPKTKDSFFEHHREWGNKIRIGDYELAGLKMRGDDDADVFVKVAWYRVDEGDLRQTTLKQKWHAFKGDWMLAEEGLSDGDAGLLGEPIPLPAANTRGKHTQFPTIRIGEN